MAAERLTIRKRLQIWHCVEAWGMSAAEAAIECGVGESIADRVLKQPKPPPPKNRPENPCPACGGPRKGLICPVCQLIEIRQRATQGNYQLRRDDPPPEGLKLRGQDKIRYYAMRRKSELDT